MEQNSQFFEKNCDETICIICTGKRMNFRKKAHLAKNLNFFRRINYFAINKSEGVQEYLKECKNVPEKCRPSGTPKRWYATSLICDPPMTRRFSALRAKGGERQKFRPLVWIFSMQKDLSTEKNKASAPTVFNKQKSWTQLLIWKSASGWGTLMMVAGLGG